MPPRRSGDRRPPTDSSLADTIDALRTDMATLRRGQLKLIKAVVDLRHELSHRLSTSREDLGALLKASHAELCRHLERVEQVADDSESRLTTIEREMESLFGGES